MPGAPAREPARAFVAFKAHALQLSALAAMRIGARACVCQRVSAHEDKERRHSIGVRIRSCVCNRMGGWWVIGVGGGARQPQIHRPLVVHRNRRLLNLRRARSRSDR
eukprot:6210913-Pleurochrysis_carterae.AAC.1